MRVMPGKDSRLRHTKLKLLLFYVADPSDTPKMTPI
jgi:hypothetical protein